MTEVKTQNRVNAGPQESDIFTYFQLCVMNPLSLCGLCVHRSVVNISDELQPETPDVTFSKSLGFISGIHLKAAEGKHLQTGDYLKNT